MHPMQTGIANRVRELREAKGLIRSEVAAAVKVDQSTVWRWEQGNPIPDAQKVALAALFEVSPAYLMRWTEEAA